MYDYISPASPRRSSPNRLFYLDRRPGLLELHLDLGGLVLVDAFLDRLGRAFNQILGLLEAESGDRPHLFDDVDLLFARSRQDDGEFGLSRRRGGCSSRASRG